MAHSSPSLLSRLSPLPLAQPTSEKLSHQETKLSNSRENLPFQLANASRSPGERSGGLAIAHAALRAASGEAAGQAFLSTSSSPKSHSSISRSYLSTSKSSPSYPIGSSDARARPISSAGRNTASSRWAPVNLSPQTPRSKPSHSVSRGFTPTDSATAPTQPSTSPALNQIEAMLSQLRTGSPSKSSSSSPPFSRSFQPVPPKQSESASTLSSPSLDKTPSLLSASLTSGLHTEKISNTSQKMSQRSTESSKRPALGGKSRWARDSDEEPELVEIPRIMKQESVIEQKGETAGDAVGEGGKAEGGEVEEGAKEEPELGSTANASSRSVAGEVGSVPTETLSISDSASSPPSPSFAIQVEHHHIDWAEDNDDELPDLDDWGIEAFSPVPAPLPDLVPATNIRTHTLPSPLPSVSFVPDRPKHRRKKSSSIKPSSVSPPTIQPVKPKPAKPTARLFESARAATVGNGTTLAPPHLSKQPPPHQQPRPRSEQLSTSQSHPAAATRETSWRNTSGPSPALFAKLSGLPSIAREGGRESRRSRGGRSRTSTADKVITATTAEKEKEKDKGSEEKWETVKKGGKGGGGSQTSRWA